MPASVLGLDSRSLGGGNGVKGAEGGESAKPGQRYDEAASIMRGATSRYSTWSIIFILICQYLTPCHMPTGLSPLCYTSKGNAHAVLYLDSVPLLAQQQLINQDLKLSIAV